MSLWLQLEQAGLGDSRPLAEVLMLAWVNRLHKPVGQALSCTAALYQQGTP